MAASTARVSSPASAGWNVAKTLAHTVVFWAVFLFVIPAGVVALESALGLDGWRFASDAGRVAGMVLFVLGGALGLSTSSVMAVVGKGTPLPTDCARAGRRRPVPVRAEPDGGRRAGAGGGGRRVPRVAGRRAVRPHRRAGVEPVRAAVGGTRFGASLRRAVPRIPIGGAVLVAAGDAVSAEVMTGKPLPVRATHRPSSGDGPTQFLPGDLMFPRKGCPRPWNQ